MPDPMNWYKNRAMSQQTAQQYPDMDLAWLQMQSQMPKEAQAVRSIRPMNWLEQHLAAPGAQAMTLPWRTILFNPSNYRQGGMRPDDLLAHEMTHAGQLQQGGWGFLMRLLSGNTQQYGDRPYEQAAFDTEARRAAKRKDIPLPPKRKR